MAKKKSVPLNSEEALAHLSAGLGGIPIRYGSGPSVTAVPDRANSPKRKGTTVDNPKLKCESCGNKGAMDYAGQGRVCKSCANKLGF